MRSAYAVVILALLACALLTVPDLAFWVAGFKPLASLDAQELDEPAKSEEEDVSRFLGDRNEVEVVVPRDMALSELLRLYQAEFPHIRRQIARQKGQEDLPESYLLRQGERFKITLTPPSEGVP